MFEALRAVVPLGFNEIEMHRIQASCFPENEASIKLLERLGFRREGLLRKYSYIKHRDAWEDCLVMALLKEECDQALLQGSTYRILKADIYIR